MVEHWGNAVKQAEIAAHNMLASPETRRAHTSLPAFWSNQFGVNIRSVGLPPIADTIMLTQGSVEERRVVAVYGQRGRMVAAVAVNRPRSLPAYQALIEARAPFPPDLHAADGPAELHLLPAGFPRHGQATHDADATPAGAGPSSPAPLPEGEARAWRDPRVPLGVPPLG